jgi:hypothetical protein
MSHKSSHIKTLIPDPLGGDEIKGRKVAEPLVGGALRLILSSWGILQRGLWKLLFLSLLLPAHEVSGFTPT